jgi:hypothetical protein
MASKYTPFFHTIRTIVAIFLANSVAEILGAATYPDQVVAASNWLNSSGTVLLSIGVTSLWHGLSAPLHP